MGPTRFNWQIWAGFLLSVFAMLSYPLVFVEWPLTRDFPWVNILLFVIAAVFVIVGVRRAFGADRGWFSKIGAVVLTALGALVLGLFIMVAFVASTWLPTARSAPQVAQKAPDFTLTDTSGRKVSLSELRSAPTQPDGPLPKGVLLIFYRGYW